MSSSKQPYTIAFHSQYLDGRFFRQLRAGVYDILRQHGMRMLIVQAPLADTLTRRLAAQHIDGWVTVVGSEGSEAIAASGKPLVTISHHVPDTSIVKPDNAGGVQAACTHLISLGHRHIAFIGNFAQSDMLERLTGYRESLAAAGIRFDEHLVVKATASTDKAGYEAARTFFASGIFATAIIAGNDLMAYGIMQALQERGLRVPEDMAIVGFDDDPEAQDTSPPLTTVRQSYLELGRAATRQLLLQIADPTLKPVTIEVATHLIVRASCGTPALRLVDTGNTLAAPVETDLAFGSDAWKDALARRLVSALRHPAVLPTSMPPESFWPGVNAVVAALASSENSYAISDSALRQAWIEASETAAHPHVIGQLLDILAAATNAESVELGEPCVYQLRAGLQRLRDQLLSISLGASAQQLLEIEDLTYSSNRLTTDLVSASDRQVQSLAWMQHEGIAWAYLGLWQQEPGGMLSIAGSFPNLPIRQAPQITCEAFPPLPDALPAADVIHLAAIRTTQRDWGMIAFGLTYSSNLSFFDTSSRWIELLGVRLDNRALLDQLERERAELHTAFDRERALADTVRDLGCPVIPLGHGVLLIPLIGVINSARAQLIIEMSLATVSSQRATKVLLDVSGVPLIDTHVAAMLIQLAQMVQLLGAKTGIVGVRPEIAQSIISLGVDLRQLQSYASLEVALRT